MLQFYFLAFIPVCFSTLLPRQAGGKIIHIRPKNNNTWILEHVQFYHPVPCDDCFWPYRTERREAADPPRKRPIGASLRLRRSKFDLHKALWFNVGSDLGISCDSSGPKGEWMDCQSYPAMPLYDGNLDINMKSRLKWRVADLVEEPESKNMTKVTLQFVYRTPPGR